MGGKNKKVDRGDKNKSVDRCRSIEKVGSYDKNKIYIIRLF